MTEDQANQPTAYTSKSTFGALLFFVFISLIITWPLASKLTTEFAGGRGDQLVHRWTFWWVKEALLTGQNPFYTTMLYYPEGTSLISHNFAWLNIAFWLPLQAIVGEIVAYNFMFIAIYSLNGFALFLFARETIRHELAALLAGLIFCTWPYTLSHFDHPNMILVFPLPLALLFLGRLLKDGRWRHVILAALFLAFLGIGRWQLLLMSMPLLGAYVLFMIRQTSAERTKTGLTRLTAAGILALLLMLPLALPLLQSQLQEDPAGVAIYEPDNGRTDLLAYMMPPPLYNRFASTSFLEQFPQYTQPYDHIAADVYYVPYIGLITFLLTFLGLSRRWQQTKFWLLLVLLYIILALGPELALNRHLYFEGQTPYALLLEGTLIGDFIRRPHRLNIILALPVALIAGWGTAVLLNWPPLQKTKWRAGAVVALLALLLLAETKSVVPFITTPRTQPAWYQTVAQEEGEFGLLELPSYDRSFDKYFMAYQTQHGKPITAGHVSRLPAETRSTLAQHIPWLLYAIENDNFPDFNVTAVGTQFQQLQEQNIRYLILHKEMMNEGLRTLWRDWLTIPPTYEDDELIVYPTDLASNPGLAATQMLTAEIGLLRASFAPLAVVTGGLIKVDARWLGTAVPPANYDVCFQLVSEVQPTAAEKATCLPITANYPTSQWPQNEVIRANYRLPVSDQTPPAEYQLSLTLVNKENGAMSQTAVLGPVTIHPYQPAFNLSATWNEQIQLKGYDLQKNEDNVILIPFWQAVAPMENSNKLFVHLVNAADGQIAAQQDLIPLNWRYPTFAWETNERIRDSILLNTRHLPSGEYEIWLGWYEEISGSRLQTAAGEERLYLQTILIENE